MTESAPATGDKESRTPAPRSSRSAFWWLLTTVVLAAASLGLIRFDPQGLDGGSTKASLSTDDRDGPVVQFADKEVRGAVAHYKDTVTKEKIIAECPNLRGSPGQIPVATNGMVTVNILRMTVDGREYCALMGRPLQAEGLEIRLIDFSGRLCEEKTRNGNERLCYEIAEMTLKKANQIWRAGGALILTALLGGAATKLIESFIPMLRRRKSPLRGA